jgi:adenylate cyclase class 2
MNAHRQSGGAIEFEAKFHDVDHDALRKRLKTLGADCTSKRRLMRRVNLDFSDKRLDAQKAWARLREEGEGTVTLTLKHRKGEGVDGIHEIETTVGDYDAAFEFLTAIGLEVKSYQETYRESWQLGDTQIELDEWPWLPPLAEVEGADERSVRQVADQLGLEWSKAEFGPINKAYLARFQVTDDEINYLPAYRFEDPAPWPTR